MPTYVNSLYRFSVICGALPLVSGVLIFVSFVITGADWLQGAGLICFLFGLASFVLGVGALLWSLAANRRIKALGPGRIWGSAWLPALLLISNILVPVLWVVSDEVFTPIFTIVVQNDSPDTIESAAINGACCYTFLGTIPPHEARTAAFRIDNDGGFSLEYRQGNREHTEIIDGYLGLNQRGNQLVVVNPGGLVDVR